MAFRLGRKKWLVLAIVVAVAAVAAKVVTLVKSGPPVTISKETTFITEPLRPDGYPDYIAALNQRFTEDVTPENNAAVLFRRAMGPPFYNDQNRNEKFFEMLGMPTLPEQGDYFIELDEYVDGLTDAELPPDPKFRKNPTYYAWEEQGIALRRPWSKKEFPILAGWLAANEKPLALVFESSRRPRYFCPIIADPKEPGTSPLSQALDRDTIITYLAARAEDSFSQVARALTTRAMLRLNEGEIDEAWKDLLACHRLARLAGQGPTLVAPLIAASIDGLACVGDQALLQHANLSTSRVENMRADLAKLAPMPKMADKMNVGERYLYLDNVTTVARKAPDIIRKLLGRGPPREIKSIINYLASQKIDWDQSLRMGNFWYDRVVDAYRKPTRSERTKAVTEIEADLRKLRKATTATVANGKSLAPSVIRNLRETPSQWLSQTFVCLWMPWIRCIDYYDRATMRIELTDLAFALAAFRADQGAYPAKLHKLVPKYVKAIPKDIFNNDADLHYTRQDNGYLLYSFGPNGIDDGGKGRDDRINHGVWNGEDWDDIPVRIMADNSWRCVSNINHKGAKTQRDKEKSLHVLVSSW